MLSCCHSTPYFWECILFKKKTFYRVLFSIWSPHIKILFLILVYSCYMICLTRCDMFERSYAREVAYWECGMWDIQDVGCWGCGMLGMWDVGDVGCSRCGTLGMWDVQDVGCAGCGMCRMWNVRDVGCLGCGMLIYKIPDLERIFNSAKQGDFMRVQD